MGQVLQTNGNYELRVSEGGTIRLNTGPQVGQVVVTGDLVVEGNSISISSENLDIKDNIITLNKGETGDGVSLNYSGIQVDRGTESLANFIYDESVDAWTIAHGDSTISLNFDNSSLKVRRILTDSNTDNGRLILIGSGTGVVNVGDRGTETPYESLVIDDNDIPNKKYVLNAIIENPTYQIKRNDTRILSIDRDEPYSEEFVSGLIPSLYHNIGVLNNTSHISFIVDGSRVAAFYKDSIQIDGMIFSSNLSVSVNISSITVDVNIATITTLVEHGLVNGDSIAITDVITDTRYNSTWSISVVDAMTLTMVLPNNTYGVINPDGDFPEGKLRKLPLDITWNPEQASIGTLEGVNLYIGNETLNNSVVMDFSTAELSGCLQFAKQDSGILYNIDRQDSIIVYAGDISAGKTGLYVINNTTGISVTNPVDEIVSKRRSLLFSMIF